MADYGIYAGDTDKTIYVFLRDSTTGLAKTGLAYNSAGIILSYVLPLAARAAITPATQTVTGAHSDGGFVEIDATNAKGLYRLDLPDAAIASGNFTIISVQFTGVITEDILIPLHHRKVDVVKLLGTAWLTPGTAGTPDVNVKLLGGTAQTGRDLGASVLLSSGAGAGQINLASGKVLVQGTIDQFDDFVDGSGQVTVGAMAAAAVASIWNALTSGMSTVGSIGKKLADWVIGTTQTADVATLITTVGSPAGASVSADIAAVKSDTAAILVDTGTTLQAEVDGIQADTEDIQSRLPAALTGAGNMKSDILAINGVTAAAVRQALAAGQLIPGTVDTGAPHTPTTTEFQADDITEATADHYKGRSVVFLTGALAGQATAIEGYSKVGANGQFTVTAMTEAPANDDTFLII